MSSTSLPAVPASTPADLRHYLERLRAKIQELEAEIARLKANAQ